MAQVAETLDRSRRVPGRIAATDIASPGHTVEISWAPVAGASQAEVTSASLTLDPATVEETQQNAGVSQDGNGWIITTPTGKRVSALSLNGFKSAGVELTATSNLPANTRIIVALPRTNGSGFDTPRFAAPSVGRRHEMPPTLTGATFSSRLLRVNPSVEAGRVRIALVTGSDALDFSEQPTELGTVHVTTEATAKNAQVLSPDGVPMWQTPEFVPDTPTAEVDLRAALEIALNKRLKEKEHPSATFMVIADAPARVFLSVRAAHGFLVRTHDGVLRVKLEGDPAAPDITDAFATEIPSNVTGDLVLRYDKMRILETVSNALPTSGAAISGWIAGDQAVTRTLPAEAFSNFAPARLGVYGRAPEDCEISIELVRMSGDVVVEAVGPPAVAAIASEGTFRTWWADAPAKIQANRANGLRVRANRGRFYWAASEDGTPLLRVAVHDPDPGGRPVFLGSTQLLEMQEASIEMRGFSFPAGAFRSQVPALASDLFLTIDFADLTLRYAR